MRFTDRQRIAELSEQLAKLQDELDQERVGQTIKDIDTRINQPPSKQPEWDKDGNPKPTTKGPQERPATDNECRPCKGFPGPRDRSI